MHRSLAGPSNNAPASVVGEEPGTADGRTLTAARGRPHMVSPRDALRSPAMSGLARSATRPGIAESDDEETADVPAEACDADDVDDVDGVEDAEHPAEVARRARWTAAGTGALLTLAGLAASLVRLVRSAPALVAAAYALGAAVCLTGALLGARGRTRRALWLLVAGVMVMALGDQFD